MTLYLEFSNLCHTRNKWLINDFFEAIADKSTIRNVFNAQVKQDLFRYVVKCTILDNIINCFHIDDEISGNPVRFRIIIDYRNDENLQNLSWLFVLHSSVFSSFEFFQSDRD